MSPKYALRSGFGADRADVCDSACGSSAPHDVERKRVTRDRIRLTNIRVVLLLLRGTTCIALFPFKQPFAPLPRVQATGPAGKRIPYGRIPRRFRTSSATPLEEFGFG